jgi:hypothetical protein
MVYLIISTPLNQHIMIILEHGCVKHNRSHTNTSHNDIAIMRKKTQPHTPNKR